MNRTRSPIAAAAVIAIATLAAPGGAQAQTTDYYLGQLQQFGTDWCPKGWAPANGQLMSIAQNQPLFSLLGTSFGGNGASTFALPDLRLRAPVGLSQPAPLGTPYGQTHVTLTPGELPAHAHGFNGDPTSGVGNSPANSMMGDYPPGQAIYAGAQATPDTPMNAAMVGATGGGQPVLTLSPILATSWCIALSGVYPSRP